MNPCFCGCGVEVNRLYVHGHNRRGAMTVVTGNHRELLFWNHVGPLGLGECWDWIGARSNKGYGYFNAGEKRVRAHRFSYELYNGPISKVMTIDHLCRNRGCVNPTHLEVVTLQENISRGNSMRTYRKTHCPAGHEYSQLFSGRRYCRVCSAIRQREYRKSLGRKESTS